MISFWLTLGFLLLVSWKQFDGFLSLFEPIVQILGGQAFLLRVLFALSVLHGVEAVVATGICLWSDMPIVIIFQHFVAIFICGVPSFKLCMKYASLYRLNNEKKVDIKIQ